VGTNYLAQYGTRISGNPTQVQNTYAPNNLYGDLGYEPLEESNPKQYRRGGVLPQAEFGDYFQSSGQASIGSGVGSAIGSAFFGPVGGEVGKLVGTVAGNLLGGAKDANALKAKQAEAQTNAMRSAWASGAQGIQGQNASFMEDGGKTSPYEWNSHTWQPQLITKFGEHNLKDLLHPPHDADMLRSGGHLKEDYVNPSASALSTERGLMPIAEDGTQLAMGGDLQVHRGKAETLSYNPFLPHGGETIMFRGPSHDNGGMPVTYGDNGVEVEGGEPATKLQDGGSPTGSNLVVYGNMKIPQFGASEIGDKDSEGRKFKHYANDVALNDKKQNQIINKATDIVNSSKDNTVFDQLALNSGKAMMMGATAKQKANAAKLEAAARVQNAILDTAKEFGYEDSDKFNQDVMKGKVKNMAKLGASIPMAQNGIGIGEDYYLDHTGTQSAPQSDADAADAKMQALGLGNQSFGNADLGNVAVASSKRGPAYPSLGYTNAPTTFTGATSPAAYPYPKEEDLPGLASPTKDKPKTDKSARNAAIAAGISSLYSFFKPTSQMPLDPDQLMGAMYALGHNQLDPVKAQLYNPTLDQPYDISLQDQLNSVDQQANAAIRGAGRNPAAQAQIMASAAEMKNKVLGEQFRANQAQKAQVYAKNRDLMNQAQLQNLNILDQQYVRQATGQSKTKEQNIAALNSIASKIAQNKLENKQQAVLENTYGDFTFGADGKLYKTGAPAQFNIPQVGSTTASTKTQPPPGFKYTYNDDGTIEGMKKEKSKNGSSISARNGSIVKALKTL